MSYQPDLPRPAPREPQSLRKLVPLLAVLVLVMLVVQIWTTFGRRALPLLPSRSNRPAAADCAGRRPGGGREGDDRPVQAVVAIGRPHHHVGPCPGSRDERLRGAARDRQRIHLGRAGAHRHELSRRSQRFQLEGDARRPKHVGRCAHRRLARSRSGRTPHRRPAGADSSDSHRHVGRPGSGPVGLCHRQSVWSRPDAHDRRHQRPGTEDSIGRRAVHRRS